MKRANKVKTAGIARTAAIVNMLSLSMTLVRQAEVETVLIKVIKYAESEYYSYRV